MCSRRARGRASVFADALRTGRVAEAEVRRPFAANPERDRSEQDPSCSAVRPPGDSAAARGHTAEKPDLPSEVFAERAATLEQRVDALIHTRRRFTDPDNARFAKRLRPVLWPGTGKHRPHLLHFLYVDGLDATNNQAQRMLRPAATSGDHLQDNGVQSDSGRRGGARHFD